jgi:hypothetical protein
MRAAQPMPDDLAPANIIRFTMIMLPMFIIHGQGGITPC